MDRNTLSLAAAYEQLRLEAPTDGEAVYVNVILGGRAYRLTRLSDTESEATVASARAAQGK